MAMPNRAFGGRTFRSLEHLNEMTVWWLAEVADVHIHRQTKRAPPSIGTSRNNPDCCRVAGTAFDVSRLSTGPSMPRAISFTGRTSIHRRGV